MLVACNAAPENRSPTQRSEVQVFLYISQLSGKVGNITLLRFYTTTDIYRQSTHGGKKNGKKIPDTGVFSRETVSSSLLMQTWSYICSPWWYMIFFVASALYLKFHTYTVLHPQLLVDHIM